MFIKLLIFGLLYGATIQALPTSDLVPTSAGRFCARVRQWYGDVTEKLKIMYDGFNKNYVNKKLSASDENQIKAEMRQFEEKMSSLATKFDRDLGTLDNYPDEKSEKDFCRKEIKEMKGSYLNLTSAAVQLKKDVLNAVDHLGNDVTGLMPVSKEKRDTLDRTLSRIVNWLFIVDLSKNMLKDVYQLLKYCYNSVRNKEKLEELYTVADGKLEALPAEGGNEDLVEDDVVVDDKLDAEVEDGVQSLVDETAIEDAEAQAAKRLAEGGEAAEAAEAEGLGKKAGEEIIEVIEAAG